MSCHVCTTPSNEIFQAKPKFILQCYIPVPMEKCKHGARSHFQRTCRFSALAVLCQAMIRFQKQVPTCSEIILRNSQSSNNATCTNNVENATFGEPESCAAWMLLSGILVDHNPLVCRVVFCHLASFPFCILVVFVSGFFLFSLLSFLLFPFLYIFFAVTLGKPVLLIFLLSITLPLSPGIFICTTPETKLHQRS